MLIYANTYQVAFPTSGNEVDFVHVTYPLLGNIPLRHLVYRVLDLPPSMRPLVYDFGQLKTDTEYQYIYQVVSNHVRKFNYPLLKVLAMLSA